MPVIRIIASDPLNDFSSFPLMPDFIYLASQSPRRRQLLEQLGVRHSLLLPNEADDVQEDAEAIEAVLPSELPLDYVERVTGLKLDAAVARLERRGLAVAPILCSDTTVALGRKIYGKPEDAADAKRMLAEISVAATPGMDFDPLEGHRALRLSYAGSEAEIREAVRRIGEWLKR